jgi:hypothetical protein
MESHTRARLPGLGGARAHDMRVNGPPKSMRGHDFLLPFYFLVAWMLNLKS